MSLHKRKKKIQSINIIPLIDIIFLMLVFFMLATNFNKNKEISFLISSQKQVSNEQNKEKLMILYIRNNEIFFNDKAIKLENLEKNYFKTWSSQQFKKIVILNDKDSSMQNLIFLLDSIKKNKIKNVNFSNEPEKIQ